MTSQENTPASPRSPRSRNPRPSLTGLFEGLNIEPSTASPTEERGRARPQTQDSEASGRSSLRGSLSQRWPPFFADFEVSLRTSSDERHHNLSPSLTLRMSNLYRQHGDNWACDTTVEDQPVDKTDDFQLVSNLMDEIHQHVITLQENKDKLASIMMEEMAKAVYGSNEKARKGLGLDETLKYCRMVFEGVTGLEYSERTAEYQAKLEQLVLKGMEFAPTHVLRSRREVVQHAAAFYHIVNSFVTNDMTMGEELIKETHRILVNGIGPGTAGFLSSKEHGGSYRTEDVFVGAMSLPKASTIPNAMRSMVRKLEKDLDAAVKLGRLDPFALAAEYCDRFVNIHPFRGGNGRMCRLVLNAILIKYAGIVVNVGEHDQSRDEYLDIARESTKVGGHAGALGSLVLTEAKNTLRRMKNKLMPKKD